MRIAIIGIGRLGTVFARVLSKNHELLLIDRHFEDARNVASEIGAQPVKDLTEARTADMAIVAVKPEHVEDVVKQLRDARLVVSCAAGVPISRYESWGVRNIIRIIPNICVDVGEAVVAYSLHPEVEQKEKVFLTAFSSLGLCVKTAESHLEAMKASSGSGPAFIAFLAEAMIEEAVANGLARETAEKCVAQTLRGTGSLMKAGWSTKKIIETVASPGGSTEAGLKMLEKKDAAKAIRDAIKMTTAKARSQGK
ncbi:MAG: pyrroline-5-carboxylate reductase dimerization domain-containing protein [Candidatus Micrarchaeota archaeon]